MGEAPFRNMLWLGALALGLAATPAWAQSVDEVIVTGSHIKQSPGDAPVPIDVVNSEDLFNIGNPSVVELVKTLGVSSGVDGETNQFQSNGLEGTANINLRGLGAGRNLVLLNGRRNVWSPGAISEQQQLFVDINMIPGVAINRVELLKDGAAATYGSDAISGVVNFITRDDFEGFEVAVSHKEIDGSDGDQDIGLIWGQDFGRTHIMASLGYNKRNKLQARERDWAIQPRGYRGNTKGYTGIGNPGAYFPVSVNNNAAAPAGASITDARCADFVGEASANTADRCTYNYVYFDNLIEEEERTNFFATLNHEFDEDMSFFAELLWGNNEVPEWNTSPSYPPQVLVDGNAVTGRIIPSYHPGLIKYAADHDAADGPFTTRVDADCNPSSRTDLSCAAFMFFGRPFGVSGLANTGFREYETLKVSAGLEGTLFNDMDYVTSIVFSTAERDGSSPDTYIERWSLALKGFGGPNCTGNTPGENGCEFYNPFSNAIQTPQQKGRTGYVNPDYRADLANSKELREWMQYDLGSTITSDLLVWDGVLTGQLDNGIDWAIGAQYREETYEIDVYEGNDLHVNPCVTDAENVRWREKNDLDALCDRGTQGNRADDYAGSGQFGFLAGATPLDEEQDITALFGELQLNPADTLEVQLSARYEDYGGKVGESFDPKLAVRWQANDNLVLRGSASTTFRGPTLNQLGGRTTTLSFVGATSSFKAVDTIGNPDLEPESATTANLGLVYEDTPNWASDDLFTFSVDYWAFDFQDPIIKQSFNDIITQSFNDADGNGAVATTDTYAGGRFGSQISCGFGADASCEGKTAGDIQRIKVNMINGPDIETDGFDIRLGYERPLGNGLLDLSAEFTLVSSYDVGSSELNESFDALNRLNDNVAYLRSIVEEKWKLGAVYKRDAHSLNFVANFTGSYEDTPSASAGARDIDSHQTYDLHYNLDLASLNDELENSAFWVSIYNLTDEDPPFARLDLNYDPYTHNPFGQMIKVGVRHKF
jgi:iron complex outermembrane receptor protein